MSPRTHALRSRTALIWAALTLIFLGAAFLRFAPIDYALPYIVNADEPNFYRLAQGERGVLDEGWRAGWLAGYPPGYPMVYAAIVEGMNRLHVFDVHQDMARVVGLMRIVNASIDLVTMALVITLAGQLSGWRATLLAAGVYAVSRPFVQNAALALPDPLLTMLVTLCALCGLYAWRRDSVMWGLLSTGAGLLAVVVKYPAAPILILPALFFLRQLVRRRAAALQGAAASLLMVAAVGYGLWVVYGAGTLSNAESNEVSGHFLENTLSSIRWFNVIKAIGGTLGLGLFVGMLAALIRRRLSQEILLIALGGLVVLALVPGYLAPDLYLYPVRYTLPAAGIILAVAAAMVTRLINRWPNRIKILISLACVGLLLPDLFTYAYPLRLRNPYTEAQQWFETNVPNDSVIWMESFNPFTSLSRYDRGYRGFKEFPAYFAPNIPEITPEGRQSVNYIFLTANDEKFWPLSQGWEKLQAFTRIKTFIGPDETLPYLAVYLPYMLPEAQTTPLTLGDVRLVLRGVDVKPDSNTVNVQSYWQADAVRPPHDYSYSLYLTPVGSPSDVAVQQDSGLGQRPTSSWDDSMEILSVMMGPIDVQKLSGDYDLWLVIYDSQTGARFVQADGKDSMKLKTLTFSR